MKDAEIMMEIDRIKNLVSNFGWKIAKQKVTEKEIELVLEKQISKAGETTPLLAD